MRIENSGEVVVLVIDPDVADTLATLLHAALMERMVNLNPDEQEEWEKRAETIYHAAYQAHAITAKNLGG